MKPYAWAELVKSELDQRAEKCVNRRRAEATLREVAEYAEREADVIRDYEMGPNT